MKAMILAAGFGTRLKPLTDTIPKALVDYKGKPLIVMQIERLESAGVSEIVVNAHHFSDKMRGFFLDNDFGVEIHLITEKEILGTGGGILNAAGFLSEEDFFIAINVDVETDFDLSKMIIYHEKNNSPLATMLVQKRKTVRFLCFDGAMNFRGRANEHTDEKNKFAFNGIHIISKRIFEKKFDAKYCDIIDLYIESTNTGEIIKGFDAGDSYFKDIGKIEALE